MSDSDNTKDWDEAEALRASLREHMAEIKRLNECLTWEQHRAEHVGTHGPGCAMWGPKHYECLLRAHEALQKRTSQESRQVEPVAWITPGQDLHLVNYEGFQDWVPLYTAPPTREPLTDEQIIKVIETVADSRFAGPLGDLVRAVERAHGIGGEE